MLTCEPAVIDNYNNSALEPALPSPEPTSTPALWVSTQQVGESDALVRFFTPGHGALLAKARGLFKPGSKMAPNLKAADELSIALAGSRGTRTLAGILATQGHAFWRDDLSRLALVWFMTECAYIGSGPQQLNEQVYQLTANLLRTRPEAADLHSAASVFAIRLLTLHGLMADLDHSIVTHAPLSTNEPVFLLPSGEGLIDLASYNQQYARGRAGLLQLSAERHARWRSLQRQPLLDYPQSNADSSDTAILCSLLARHLSNLGNQPLETMKFLKKQWRLPSLGELMRAD
jgi:recombinational DNA repair protein (RecF pathway)